MVEAKAKRDRWVMAVGAVAEARGMATAPMVGQRAAEAIVVGEDRADQ